MKILSVISSVFSLGTFFALSAQSALASEYAECFKLTEKSKVCAEYVIEDEKTVQLFDIDLLNFRTDAPDQVWLVEGIRPSRGNRDWLCGLVAGQGATSLMYSVKRDTKTALRIILWGTETQVAQGRALKRLYSIACDKNPLAFQ